MARLINNKMDKTLRTPELIWERLRYEIEAILRPGEGFQTLETNQKTSEDWRRDSLQTDLFSVQIL
jgi:hypothetical protein